MKEDRILFSNSFWRDCRDLILFALCCAVGESNDDGEGKDGGSGVPGGRGEGIMDGNDVDTGWVDRASIRFMMEVVAGE